MTWKKMEVNPQIIVKWINDVCNDTKKLKKQESWWIIESIDILQQTYSSYELTKSKSYSILKQELRLRKLDNLGI